MSTPTYSIDNFSVGDYVVFERSYSSRDFSAFSELSGDANPLHHNNAYASGTRFGKPIVPLHITLAPLSMVAGMVLPGEPSLYLSHEVRAAYPVYFGETLCYSARIESINISHRILGLRVLALRGCEVVLDATMRVQAHAANWSVPPAIQVHKSTVPAAAVITGGSGEIGAAIALELAKQGWRLLLQDRGDKNRRGYLEKQLSRAGADATFLTADLATQDGRETLVAAIRKAKDVGLIVHAASPLVTSSVEDLVSVNFSALKQMIEGSLPGMLARQRAAFVLVGSSAVDFSLPGWEAYAGAKSMAANLIDSVERKYAVYGVRGLTIMPGLVATRFSTAYRGEAPALLPQEVAEAVLRLIKEESVSGNVVMLEPGRYRRGRRSFRETGEGLIEAPAMAVAKTAVSEGGGDRSEAFSRSSITSILRKSLRLADNLELADAGLGITPGWDSLKHIELILEIESAFGLKFSAEEIESTHDIARLDALCRRKLAEKE